MQTTFNIRVIIYRKILSTLVTVFQFASVYRSGRFNSINQAEEIDSNNVNNDLSCHLIILLLIFNAQR